MDPKKLEEFIARLPEHLRFFFEPAPKELDAEELVEFSRQRLKKVQEHREELMAHGIAADRFIDDLSAKTEILAGKNEEVSKAEDALLHAKADLADVEYDLFLAMKKQLKAMEEENPFHPLTEQLRETIEELTPHFPKQQDDESAR